MSARSSGMNFGRYYAIVIGNQNYQPIESLQTPKYDAARAARILADKYGFTVQILDDANDITMLKTINDLNAVLKPEDNVLIYYAGHGTRLKSGTLESGYWLPVNADAPPEGYASGCRTSRSPGISAACRRSACWWSRTRATRACCRPIRATCS